MTETEPTLAELLDQLIDAASYMNRDIGETPEDSDDLQSIRATILARFGGDGVLVSRSYVDAAIQCFLMPEYQKMLADRLANPEAARDPFSHSPGQD